MNLAGIRTHHLAPGAWSAAMGKRLAAYTRPAFLDGSHLIVEVADPIWHAQLTSLRDAILARLEQVVGHGIVTSIEFRVAPPKRAPQLAPALPAPKSNDEADGIRDPVLRRIYIAARRKSTA